MGSGVRRPMGRAVFEGLLSEQARLRLLSPKPQIPQIAGKSTTNFPTLQKNGNFFHFYSFQSVFCYLNFTKSLPFILHIHTKERPVTIELIKGD